MNSSVCVKTMHLHGCAADRLQLRNAVWKFQLCFSLAGLAKLRSTIEAAYKQARIRACMPCRVDAYSLKLVCWLLGDWWWKTTPDVLDQDEHRLEVWYGAEDGIDSFGVGQHKIHKQDAATKKKP